MDIPKAFQSRGCVGATGLSDMSYQGWLQELLFCSMSHGAERVCFPSVSSNAVNHGNESQLLTLSNGAPQGVDDGRRFERREFLQDIMFFAADIYNVARVDD